MKTLFVSLALVALLSQAAPSPQPTTESLALEVAALKRQVSSLEQRLDLVIATVNRQNTAAPTAAPTRPQFAPETPRPAPTSSRTQCQATTRKGTQCSRLAAAGSSYCWQHAR